MGLTGATILVLSAAVLLFAWMAAMVCRGVALTFEQDREKRNERRPLKRGEIRSARAPRKKGVGGTALQREAMERGLRKSNYQTMEQVERKEGVVVVSAQQECAQPRQEVECGDQQSAQEQRTVQEQRIVQEIV